MHQSELMENWTTLAKEGIFQAHRSIGLRRLKMIWVTDAKAFPDYRLWVRF